MATIRGAEYKATGTDSKKRNIHKRRAVYRLSGSPTREQEMAIARLEKGIHDDWRNCSNPYSVMRGVEALGIELSEEEQREDGKWYPIDDPDIRLSMMETGAL